MVVRKRQIIAAALVLALGSAVFINWYYNRPSVKNANTRPSVEEVENTGGNLGDAKLVSSSGVSESAAATGKNPKDDPEWAKIESMSGTTGHYFRGVE